MILRMLASRNTVYCALLRTQEYYAVSSSGPWYTVLCPPEDSGILYPQPVFLEGFPVLQTTWNLEKALQ